jgi:hypothetical protein
MSTEARTKNYHTSREDVKANARSSTFPLPLHHTQNGSSLFPRSGGNFLLRSIPLRKSPVYAQYVLPTRKTPMHITSVPRSL